MNWSYLLLCVDNLPRPILSHTVCLIMTEQELFVMATKTFRGAQTKQAIFFM